jgi:hypothetical protein
MHMKTKRIAPGRLWRLSCCLIVLLISVGTARRVYAVSTTTVQDVVYRADGQPAAGTLVISWPAFTTGDNFAVAAGSLSVAIGPQGAISIPLVPNVGGTPDRTYYKVMYKLSDGSTSEEYWLVPATGTTTIAAIRSKIVPAGVAMQMASRQYVDSAIASTVKLCTASTVQTCIDSLASTGGTVYLAPTTYTGPLTLPDSGKCVNLVGSGVDVTVLTVSAPATAVVYKGNSSLPVGCRISDLTVDGNLQTTYGLQLLMGKGWVIERVKVRKIVPDSGEGIALGESAVSSAEFYEARIRDISIAYESGSYAAAHRPLNGIHFLQSASDNKVSQITAWNMANAGIVDDAGDNQYIQVHVYGFPLLTYYPNYAMEITGNAHITQLTSDGVTLGGVHVRGNGNSVTASTFQWPTPGGQVAGAFPIVADAGTDFNVYRDNVVRNGSGLAISGLNPVFAKLGGTYYPGNNTEIAGNVNYGDSTDGGTFVAFYPIGQAVWGAGTPHGGMTLMTPYTGQPTLTLRASSAQTADFFDLYANDNMTLLAHVDVNGNASFASVNLNGGTSFAKVSGTPSSPQQAIFTDSTHIGGQAKPYIDVRDYGAACDGSTDDTTAVNNAIAAVPNNGTIVFPPNCPMKVTSTVTFQNKAGIKVQFNRAADSNAMIGSSSISGFY